MALERQPKYAVTALDAIKTYRPAGEWVGKWHTVLAKESFVTIASRYGVPADQIIQLNFPGAIECNRVVPEIVNWYLHYHVDFQESPETHDRRNRMFRGGELIAIPKRIITLPEIELRIQRPKEKEPGFKLPDLMGVGEIFTGEKFAYEFKYPAEPKEIGYFLVQAKGSLEGELAQRTGIIKTQFKKDQIKFQIEQKLSNDLKAAYSLKIDQKKTIKAIEDAIRKGSKEEFVKAITSMFEFSLKKAFFKSEHGQVVGELGAEFSLTPVILRLAGEYKETYSIGGFLVDGKFTVKGGVNVGLSRAGWAEVAKRVGWETIKNFLTGAGRSLAATWELMVAEGIVAGGAVVVGTVLGTLAITALMAWLVVNAGRKGELQGLARWYSSAYKAKVFRYERPTGFLAGGPEANKLRDELVALGERDAVTMAETVVRDLNETALYPTEAQKLERLAEIMISALGNGHQGNAEQVLLNRLNQETERRMGL